MRIPFRQGIVTYPVSGNLQNFLVSSGVGYYTEAGDSGSGTGIFDPKFLSVDDSPSALPTFQMSLDGVPVTYVLQRATTAPGPGEVNVIGQHGDFLFNAADVGKVVTGTYKYTIEGGT